MITTDDVLETLYENAGEPDAGAPTGDVSDVDFADLGYDSLALMEVASVLGKQLGIAVSDDIVVDARTPQAFADLINTQLAATAA